MKSFLSLWWLVVLSAFADIPKPYDAPQPLSPEESAKAFAIPSGMKLRLLATEPLIHEPSGICWDERGRVFVCELHGYNAEGQYDIDALNTTGNLDLEVRRIQASDEAKRKAESDTYGTVKLLLDSNNDGRMDKSVIWADRLPPCYGIVAANGGLIVACAPHIIFLKDTDGDDLPDVNEKLFSGFTTGALERGINAPTLGPDGWIYFGKGWPSNAPITGPHLPLPVTLPDSDFRIRADGTAIEPVSGSTRTIGTTFTAGGDRFITTTTSPGLFVTPIEWRYLQRNPDAAAPRLDEPASDETKVYPIAPVHPWRTKREQHPEYFAFYRKISLSDAAASGFFTSACSPLVYQHEALPGLHGHYLVCEPAASLIHRSQITRDGTRLRLRRLISEEKREFLASRDPWFHPVSLTQTPDGGIAICDFYREIIEDYSAIPRHLQQQYGVINGHDRGRIWLLLPEDESRLKPMTANLSDIDQKVLSLRAADADNFKTKPELEDDLLEATFDQQTPPQLALQAALSLGQIESPEAFDALRRLAQSHGTLRWMDAAIASSVHRRERNLLLALAKNPRESLPVMLNLAGVIAARCDPNELSGCLNDKHITGKVREVLALGLEESKPLPAIPIVAAPTPPSTIQIATWEKLVPQVIAEFKSEPSIASGKTLFTSICSACHRSHGIGVTVGPDLDAEFQRAPETILRDILFPSEAARPGYETMMIKTKRGEVLLGVTASESPTSLTLKMPGGLERTVLRKRATISTVRNVSLMPAGLGETVTPRQIADIIAFLRSR